MSLGTTLPVRMRTQRLVENTSGYRVWQVEEEQRTLDATETALVLCDVWDAHTCRGAEERLGVLLPRMQQIVPAMRGNSTPRRSSAPRQVCASHTSQSTSAVSVASSVRCSSSTCQTL